MAGNELLYGLIALGGAVMVLVLGINLYQDRKHRREAEKAFRSEHRDVLLEASPTVDAAIRAAAGDGRIEPAPAPASRMAQPAPIGRATEPELPPEVQAIDFLARIEAPAGIVAGMLVTSAGGPLSQLPRVVRWYALDDEALRWDAVDGHAARTCTRMVAALQLADRRGPVSERELDVFIAAIQRVCDQQLAVPRFADRADALGLAQDVDRFCASVDIQIAINVVAGEQPFPGTKLRGLAEAAGLQLDRDGCFHARDEHGRTQFVLSNRDASLFSAEALRHLVCDGVTLSLDVPRVLNGAETFNRMALLARQLSDALGGSMVDDNRRPLGDGALALIAGQIREFHEQMARQGIPAGSAIALRLFG